MNLIKEVDIGGLKTENNIFLAPLAGIGDNAYRIMGRRFGAGLTFSEMVSANGITRNNKKTLGLLRISDGEKPAGIQVFGSDPSIMSRAVSRCCEHPVDLIDINGGCPVKKVLKSGAGAKILADPGNFYRIVKTCVDSALCPVSVKIRLGVSEDKIKVIENAIAAQEAGASLLTLHPRTAGSKFGGKARWEYIGLVKQRLTIPVCGNGDIKTPSDAVAMVLETGCDAVMVGRAAIGNPWIVREIVDAFRAYPDTPDILQPTREERIQCALEHLNLVKAFKGEGGMHEVKLHIHRYLKGMRNVSRVREGIFRLKTEEELKEKLEGLL